MARVGVSLDPVPETLLWTLWHRAVEARRSDSVIDDPLALELVERIDFPFAERFGSGESLSQWQALRARCFDGVVGRFLAVHPGATVVALGEGLETQLWRVDDERVHWVTVDLPEVTELRRALLPAHGRNTLVASSALEPGAPAYAPTRSGMPANAPTRSARWSATVRPVSTLMCSPGVSPASSRSTAAWASASLS